MTVWKKMVEALASVLSAPTDEEVKEKESAFGPNPDDVAASTLRGQATLHAAKMVVDVWNHNSGRVIEAMGSENPRVEAIDEAISALRVLLTSASGDEATSPSVEPKATPSSPSPSPQQQKEESPNGGNPASTDAATVQGQATP